MFRTVKPKEWLTVILGTAVAACAVYFFMQPSNIIVGSAAALAMVIRNFLPLPLSVITLIINLVLMVVSFVLISREFAVKTVFSTLLLPLILGLLEVLFPNVESVTGDPFLDMIGYIFVVGIGLAILFSTDASSGGLDIVAKVMHKYLHMDLGQAMSLSGMLVALSSALCYDKKTVFLSVIGTYFGGLLIDHFIFGMNIKRRVCILSPQYPAITDFILHELHSGASLYDAVGAYDQTPRREIVTIVDNAEYKKLMDFVHRTDPKAFVTVYSVNSVSYQPKK